MPTFYAEDGGYSHREREEKEGKKRSIKQQYNTVE